MNNEVKEGFKPIPPSLKMVREGENPRGRKAKLRNHKEYLLNLAKTLESRYIFYDDTPKKIREIAKDLIK